MEQLIAKTLDSLGRRIRLIVGRAVIRMVDDTLKEQGVQLNILSGETRSAERYQHYGFTSHPFEDGEAIFVSANGCRDHIIVIADGDRRYRLKAMETGEVALYDDQGQVIRLARDKTIHVYGTDHLVADIGQDATVTCPQITAVASSMISLQTPLVECSHDLQVNGNGMFDGGLTMTGANGSGDITTPGDISDGVRSMAADRAIYDGHDHDDPQGGTVGAPNQKM